MKKSAGLQAKLERFAGPSIRERTADVGSTGDWTSSASLDVGRRSSTRSPHTLGGRLSSPVVCCLVVLPSPSSVVSRCRLAPPSAVSRRRQMKGASGGAGRPLTHSPGD